ncbi:hypothetical protein AHAS_Ahas12G0116300 [Arachis hypogaea]
MVKQNSMRYYPPSPISNGGWEYHQEISNSEHSNPWSYASEPQDEQENHMGYFSPPQNDSSHYSNGGWEYYQRIANSEQSIHMRYRPTSPPIFTFENSSSLNYAQHKIHPKTHNQHKLPIAKDSQSLSPCSKDMRRRQRNSGKNKRTPSQTWK